MSAADSAWQRPVLAIPVPCALGGPDPEVARGPAQLAAAGLLDGVAGASWDAPLTPLAGARLESLGQLCRSLADRVAAAIAAGVLPLVVGGDHAIAAGTWRGVGRALGTPPGLIWLDAHLDAHTLATSCSGNPHGMSLAALLGFGAPELTGVPGPPLDPQHVCVIGARSFEPSEPALLRRLGVRVFAMDEIARRGLPEVFGEALAIAGPRYFGLSLDIDVINPAEAKGVDTPAPGGIAAAELLPLLRGLARLPGCRAIELAEYDPGQDGDGRTAAILCALVAGLFAATV